MRLRGRSVTVPVTTDPRDLFFEPYANLVRKTPERDFALSRRRDAGGIKLVGVEILLDFGMRRFSPIRPILGCAKPRGLSHRVLDLRRATSLTRHRDVRFVAHANVRPLGLMRTA